MEWPTWEQFEAGAVTSFVLATGAVVVNLIKSWRGDGTERVKANVAVRKINLAEDEQNNAHDVRMIPIISDMITKEIARSEKLQLSLEQASADLRAAKLREIDLQAQLRGVKDDNTKLGGINQDINELVSSTQSLRDEVRILRKEKRVLLDENTRLRDEYRAAKLLYKNLLPEHLQRLFDDPRVVSEESGEIALENKEKEECD